MEGEIVHKFLEIEVDLIDSLFFQVIFPDWVLKRIYLCNLFAYLDQKKSFSVEETEAN